MLRGYDRATVDVDAVALEIDQDLERFVEAASEQGLTLRLGDGIQFARQHRVLLFRSPGGTGVDIALGALPFEDEVVARATLAMIDQIEARVATVEDLLIMKLIAGRPQDLDDVRRLSELYPDLDEERVKGTVTEYAALLEDAQILQNMEMLLPGRPDDP